MSKIVSIKKLDYLFFFSEDARTIYPALENIAIPIKTKITTSRITLAFPNISKIKAEIKHNIPKTNKFSFFFTI